MDSHRKTSNRPHAGGREDCWSEGATETLIEAWIHRYLQLNKGSLRQKDWIEISYAVNSRQNGLKPQRTDIQCRSRIDTLKKKYKLEKSKPSPSKWPFYSRLHYVIGGADAPLTPLAKKSEPKPKPISCGVLNSGGSDQNLGISRGKEEFPKEETTAYKELSRVILRFGEKYERIENAKQEQMMELEKQRLEFTKEMEFQRLNMFVETQLQIAKLNRSARNMSSSGIVLSEGKITTDSRFGVR